MTFSEKQSCSGCTACMYLCPAKCITMQADQEGFLYPQIDEEKCLHCGLCEKRCPTKNEQETKFDQLEQYACQILNEEVRAQSTSGGMFSAIAEYVLSQNGAVYAAGFDENCHVVHQRAERTEELIPMRMSKYVQSDLGYAISRIHEDIAVGKIVFFVGTPCQTDGVIESFGKNLPTNLITADLVCYGVPSPGLYDKWLESIRNHHGQPVKNVYFRDKKYGYSGVNVKLVLQNGKVLEDRADVKSYGKTMFSKIGLRPSCYHCAFRERAKRCDFTFGDMWDISKYAPEMDDDKGTTLLSVHTDKGNQLLNRLTNVKCVKIAQYGEEEAEKLRRADGRLHKTPHPKREAFFADSATLSYDALIQKYLPTSFKNQCAIVLKPVIRKLPGSRLFFTTLKQLKVKRNKRSVAAQEK